MKPQNNIVPEPIIKTEEGSDFGILGYGSTDPAILEAIDQFHDAGTKVNFCRVRSIPFTEDVTKFIEANSIIYVVEINRDGQMCQLLQINYPEYANKFVKVCHADGLALTAKWIREEIQSHREK